MLPKIKMVKRSRSSARSVSRGRRTKRARSSSATAAVSRSRSAVKSKSRSKSVVSFATKSTPVNQLGMRAAMKKSGTKIAPKGKKNVKVSRLFSSKVQEVLAGKEPRGTYVRVHFSPIGIFSRWSATPELNNCLVTSPQNGISSISCLGITNGKNNGNTASMQAQSFYNPDPATGVLAPLAGGEWTFFTAAKILDAASVLFNRKDPVGDYNIGLSNLAVSTTLAGVPTGRSTSGLKIHVIKSSVDWLMKNNSQRQLTVEFYHCRPKTNVIVQTPLTQLTQAAEIDSNIGPGEVYNGPWVQPADIAGSYLAQQIGVDPGAFPRFTNAYTVEKLVIVINPGETCTHTIKGPHNFVADWSKFNAGEQNAQAVFQKFNTLVFAKVYADLVDVDRPYSAGSTVNDIPGHYVVGSLSDSILSISDPLSCKITEKFVIGLPDFAGFINRDEVDGQPVELNLRRPAKCFITFPKLGPELQNARYVKFDEEQPGTAIDQSMRN